MATETWYIAIVRSICYSDSTLAQCEGARLGPFTLKQLEPALKKIIYRKEGAIRVLQSSWQQQTIK